MSMTIHGGTPQVPLPFAPGVVPPGPTLLGHINDRNDPHGTLRLLHESMDGFVTGGRFVPETCQIELLHGDVVLSSIDASPFVKDGMVSSVTVSNGNLVIEWNSDSGAAEPTVIPLTQIFNPSNYYDANTADGRFVAKETGKRLMTDAEGTKLSGVEAGAKDNVVEAAGASAFPQTGVTGKIYVAKDENKTYRWDGSQYVQVGGSSVTIDGTLSVPGAAADAKATGDALAARPTKAQLDAGWWSDWSCNPATFNGEQITIGPGVGGDEYAPMVGDTIIGNPMTTIGPDGSLRWPHGDWNGEGELVATRHRVAAPVPTKTSDLVNDSGFLAQHQQLTPVYSQTPTFTAWEVTPPDLDGVPITLTPLDDGWEPSAASPIGLPKGDATSTHIIWLAPNEADIALSATRTRTDIVGYTLGGQTTKPLQPQGEYAPATNIAKTALASDVQTSLGKADTAVQPAALAGYATIAQLPYDLGTPTVIDTASSEVVEGETVNYGAATLANRTANIVGVAVALDELRVTIPPAVSGKVRDFGLYVAVGVGEGTALAAPALVPVAPTGETITLMNAEGEMPTLADGTTTASGTTVLYFTEVASGTFLVKGEQVEEVA